MKSFVTGLNPHFKPSYGSNKSPEDARAFKAVQYKTNNPHAPDFTMNSPCVVDKLG